MFSSSLLTFIYYDIRVNVKTLFLHSLNVLLKALAYPKFISGIITFVFLNFFQSFL